MRRALSIALLILGCWALACEVLIAWIGAGETPAMHVGVSLVMLALSLPFLLLGLWASPGRRFADLGITMVIAAAIGAGSALTIFMMLSDPRFLLFLPFQSPARNLTYHPLLGAANLVLIGGVGWLLWNSDRKRTKRTATEGVEVLGDE
jgi:hypothetical protein